MVAVALVSLEPWDDTWRRNQHIACRLVKAGDVASLIWIAPPVRRRPPPPVRPQDGITVLTPHLRLPRRLGGVVDVARRLRSILVEVDVLWVNDPRLGAHLLEGGTQALYDVTDDWRSYPFPDRLIRGLVRAEDRLAESADTVVCSKVLADRWHDRYGLSPCVIHNGVDLDAHRVALPVRLPGLGPHIGYVGTLQPQRLDVELVLRLASETSVGTVHLLGPDALGDDVRQCLRDAEGVMLHPPVEASRVPSWMAAMDVLVAPHLVNAFTLSLDAIKAYEYCAARKPVVATPTSGFQHLAGAGVRLGEGQAFITHVRESLASPASASTTPVPGSSWDDRARAFGAALRAARS